MNRTAISNISELRSEINRLRIIDDKQNLAIRHRFNSPSAVLASALTLFPKSAAARSITDHGIFHPDLLSLTSRFMIPMTLNKTLFRHSNFLVKLMVGYASQKVSPYVTEENIERFAVVTKSTLANLFNKKRQQKNQVAISSP